MREAAEERRRDVWSPPLSRPCPGPSIPRPSPNSGAAQTKFLPIPWCASFLQFLWPTPFMSTVITPLPAHTSWSNFSAHRPSREYCQSESNQHLHITETVSTWMWNISLWSTWACQAAGTSVESEACDVSAHIFLAQKLLSRFVLDYYLMMSRVKSVVLHIIFQFHRF